VQTAIPCLIFRGGTSKGLYFHARDLPSNKEARDTVLLAAMGSPDSRQIDGMGGSTPLTSKVAIISPPSRPDADVDYLFLQVVVDQARVDTSQNCGNILAGIGPFAIEEGLVPARRDRTDVRIHMVNTASIAVAQIETPNGQVRYDGGARIDGVPGTHAPILLNFLDVAGSSCGALLPTGKALDIIAGVECTLIDNGMPVVAMRATDFGKTGYETPAELEADTELRARVEAVRLLAGPLMNLGDVDKKNVPKMCLASSPRDGGTIATRSFIPHRVHEAIGVLGAVSVATACILPGSIANEIAKLDRSRGTVTVDVEHPTGSFTIGMEVASRHGEIRIERTALLRTARLLMKGTVFVPESVWTGLLTRPSSQDRDV
jgi:4-oxalomesaconate tautomerase